MTTIGEQTPQTEAEPVQAALTALVSARETVDRLTGEYLACAQQAALTGAQVPQTITEQTVESLLGFSAAVLAFETATAPPAPQLVLRECKAVHPGDTIHIHRVGPKTVAFRAVLPPEGNYYGGGFRFTFTDGTERTWPRLARLHVEAPGSWAEKCTATITAADQAFGPGDDGDLADVLDFFADAPLGEDPR